MKFTLALAVNVATAASFTVLPASLKAHRPSSVSVCMADPKRGPTYRFGSITESIVRSVTGNENYKFGDGTKACSGGRTEDLATSAAVDTALVGLGH